MQFDLNLHQGLYAIAILFVAYVGVIYFKPIKVKVVTLFILLMMFAFSPITFKQEGMSKVERAKAREFKIPERVNVKTKSFEQKQSEELNNLKQQSKGLINETHN